MSLAINEALGSSDTKLYLRKGWESNPQIPCEIPVFPRPRNKAERVRFELTVRVNEQQFSRLPLSTAQSPLRLCAGRAGGITIIRPFQNILKSQITETRGRY